MKRSILFIISIFLTITLAAQDVSSALRQAQARFDSGNEPGAIELVNRVLAKYPDNKEAKDLLAKFNQVIKDREIDADWKVAQEKNTFEGYQTFRAKHPGSKYDDTASDNMAKKLADRFTVNSTYTDRSKAESYAKKEMTRDYVANKWKNAMTKKEMETSSTSPATSYSSSRSYDSNSSTSRRRYGSSSESYSSSSSSYRKHSYTIPNKSKFAIGIEGSIEGLQSFSTGWGLSMRIGAFNSLFNMTIGAKYQYTGYTKWVSYFYEDYYGDGRFDYDWVSGNADYKHKANQFVFPIIFNWNLYRNASFSYYWGVGYEHGVLFSESIGFEDESYDFTESGFWGSDEADNLLQLSVPSRSVIFQMGFAGRHWDWKIYYKWFANSLSLNNGEAGAIGTSFVYYF